MLHSRICRLTSLITTTPPASWGSLPRTVSGSAASSSIHPAQQLRHAALQASAVTPGAQAEGTGRSSRPWLWPSLAAASLSGFVGYQVGNVSPNRHVQPAVSALDVPAEWVAQLTQGLEEVMNGESLELQAVLRSDHLFTAMMQAGQITDLRCFYDPQQRCVHTIVRLGSGVCGYPRVQHGGFSAALMDECMGMLFYALRARRQLPFVGPAFTARLEVDYKKRVEAAPGRLLLCTAEVEGVPAGRKLRMRATLRDRPGGRVYAEGRALFVAPSTRSLIRGALKYVGSGLLPGLFSME